MNYWTALSIEYANQRSYLDDLFQVYPTIPDGIREINEEVWEQVVIAFEEKNNLELIKDLLLEKLSNAKEINTQIGNKFSKWIDKGALGVFPVVEEEFMSTKTNAILKGGDAKLTEFAQREFGYNKSKGLDFIGRFNGKYVIGEVKFLTGFGGHQNAQFNDAISTVQAKNVKAIKVIILDGYLCSLSYSKMYKKISTSYKDCNTMSVLVLREFLYQL